MTDDPIFQLLRELHGLDVEYMLTGSYASNVYGKVRSTFDADLVLALRASQMKRLVESLGKDFYFDATSLEEVQASGGQFNAVHKSSGLKVDFYLLEDGEYPRLALERRRREQFSNQEVCVISPEDLILAKLQWTKKGGSQRQMEDAKGVYEVQKSRLDMTYLRLWADRLSVSNLLQSIL